MGDGIGWGFCGIDGEISGVESTSVCHGKVMNKYFNLKILDDGGGVVGERKQKSGGRGWSGRDYCEGKALGGIGRYHELDL